MLLGVFLAVFPISFVMQGVPALLIALLGSISYFIIVRSVRIINPAMRGAALGLILGNLAGLIILVWVGLRLNLSINLWSAAVFALTLGLLRTLIPDTTLGRWLKKIFPQLILNGIRK